MGYHETAGKDFATDRNTNAKVQDASGVKLYQLLREHAQDRIQGGKKRGRADRKGRKRGQLGVK